MKESRSFRPTKYMILFYLGVELDVLVSMSQNPQVGLSFFRTHKNGSLLAMCLKFPLHDTVAWVGSIIVSRCGQGI